MLTLPLVASSPSSATYTIPASGICDLGSTGASSIRLQGTATIYSFGESAGDSEAFDCVIESAGVIIAAPSNPNNLLINYSNMAAGGYISQANDQLRVKRIGTSPGGYGGGQAVYYVEIIPSSGLSTSSTTCQWHSKDMVILPNKTSPNTKIDIIRIGELTLWQPGDMNQLGVEASHPCRITNVNFQTVDITQRGNLGLDEGYSLLPNQGYLLWALSNGIPGNMPQFRLTTGIGSGPTGQPSDYIYKAPLYYNRTDGAGNLHQIAKVDCWNVYANNTQPTVWSGATSGQQWVPVGTPYCSPTGGFNFEIIISCGSSGKTTTIGADPSTVNFQWTGNGNVQTFTLRLSGWAGTAIWVNSNDPALVIKVNGFDDQF